MQTINILPINWFGDRKAFSASEIRIITVGLNPSDKEFREDNQSKFDSKLRFPAFDGSNNSLIGALNEYFEKNPYNWFQSFEHILEGLDASYYANANRPNRVLHTDFCTPWATDPTWSKLTKSEKKSLMDSGFQEWIELVKELAPHIIIFSIPQEYVDMLRINNSITELTRFDEDKRGNKRKKPVIIRKGKYGNAIAIFGRTWNLPFGALGAEQKKELGCFIKKEYEANK